MFLFKFGMLKTDIASNNPPPRPNVFFLGFGFLNVNPLSDAPPAKEGYSRLSFYGDCVLDAIHAKNEELTDAELLAIVAEPVYDNETAFLANFEDTLECGSLILYIDYLINKYIIRRKVKGTSLNPQIAEITDTSIGTYIDYTPRNNIEYTYTVVPEYDDEFGNRINGVGYEEDGIVSFWAWILTDTEAVPVISYTFDMEIDTSDINVKKDVKMFENYTKYPAFRFGTMEYKQMTLTTIPYRCDVDTRVTDTELLDDLLAFINGGTEKILRSPSGEAWRVVTINGKYKYRDKISVGTDQPYAITFEVFEVGEVVD